MSRFQCILSLLNFAISLEQPLSLLEPGGHVNLMALLERKVHETRDTFEAFPNQEETPSIGNVGEGRRIHGMKWKFDSRSLGTDFRGKNLSRINRSMSFAQQVPWRTDRYFGELYLLISKQFLLDDFDCIFIC